MPRNLPQFTKCAAPGDAYPLDVGSAIFGLLTVGSIIGLSASAILASLFAGLSGASISGGCIAELAVYLGLITALLVFKDWFYNRRLMCIKHAQCACGTVVGQPHDGTDGDRKFEILIAPFDVPETEQLIIQTLVEMGSAGTLLNVPDEVDLQNRQVRFGYFRGQSAANQIKIYLNLVDNHMFNQPGRGYLRFLYRRVKAIMGDSPFLFSPPDEIDADSPNPMFRVNAQEGNDPEENVLVPYMHCELEGDKLARFLDNILVGLIAGAAAMATFCVLCAVLTWGAGYFLCGPLGQVISWLIALLAFLLSELINPPSDGNAGAPDVDVEDPDFDTPPSVARHGDVAYLFGDWVMDEEHDNYFEIHPIKAWYLLCQDAKNPDEWELTEEIPANQCAFDVKKLTEEDFQRICKIVQAVENTDPNDKFTTTISHALSMGPR